MLPPEWAWRTLFWIGVAPAFLVIYIRKHVPEPEVFQRARAQAQSSAERPSFWKIFSPSLLKTTMVTALLCTGVQGGYYAITTWLPTVLKTERQLSVLGTGGYLMVIIVGSFCGYIAGAYSADKLGRRANMLIFSVLSSLTVYL